MNNFLFEFYPCKENSTILKQRPSIYYLLEVITLCVRFRTNSKVIAMLVLLSSSILLVVVRFCKRIKIKVFLRLHLVKRESMSMRSVNSWNG